MTQCENRIVSFSHRALRRAFAARRRRCRRVAVHHGYPKNGEGGIRVCTRCMHDIVRRSHLIWRQITRDANGAE